MITLVSRALFSLVAGGIAAPGDEWPQILGPARDGVYAGPELAASWPEKGPALVWKKDVGEAYSAPAVAHGRLILFHRMGDEALVESLDAGSGKPQWAFRYPTRYRDNYSKGNGPRATPTVEGGRIYTLGAEGKVHALELSSGRKLWDVDVAERFGADQGYFGFSCSPLVEGNLVLLNIGGKDGAGIVAFEKETGGVAWKSTDDKASYSSPVAATIGGVRHAFVLTRAGLVSLDPANGTVRWRFPFRQSQLTAYAATPVVAGDRVFVSASYQIGAALLQVKPDGYQKLWASDDVLSNHYATSVHRDGFLFGFDGRQEGSPNLRCVELGTGKVRWSEDGFGAGSVLVAGKSLVILKENGELILAEASPAGFRPLARARVLASETRAYPALAAGRLYARDEKTLVCVDLSPGK